MGRKLTAVTYIGKLSEAAEGQNRGSHEKRSSSCSPQSGATARLMKHGPRFILKQIRTVHSETFRKTAPVLTGVIKDNAEAHQFQDVRAPSIGTRNCKGLEQQILHANQGTPLFSRHDGTHCAVVASRNPSPQTDCSIRHEKSQEPSSSLALLSKLHASGYVHPGQATSAQGSGPVSPSTKTKL